MRQILEPRFLFDASIAVTARSTGSFDADRHHSDPQRSPVSLARPVAIAADAADLGLPATDAAPAATSVLFVDPRVSNWRTLAAGTPAGTLVVQIDPSKDGLTQVSDTLAGLANVRSVDFLTYGGAGKISLGATTVDSAALMTHAGEITGWQGHLAEGAQIRFWGCDAGAGAAGAAFVDNVRALTGASVAASTDATGSAALGGNWVLERVVGTIDSTVPFSEAARSAFTSVLDLTTTASVTKPSQNTNFNTPLLLPQFDPALGTLTSVKFTLDGSVSGTSRAENIGTAATLTLNLKADEQLSLPSALGGALVAQVFPLVQATFNAAADDSVLDFGGTSGITIAGQNGTQSTSSAVLTDAPTLAAFTGTGTVSMPFSATGISVTTGSGNVVSFYSTQAGATATVTYTYIPSGPATSPVSGTVWQSFGPAPTTFNPVLDTKLAGVLVTLVSAGTDTLFGTPDDVTQTQNTAVDGTYSFPVVDAGAFKVTMPVSGSNGLPANETLIANPFGNITTSPGLATGTVTGGTPVTGVDFAYELPDTKPVLGNWATGQQILAPGQSAHLSTTAASTAVDTELDRLVTTSTSDYAGSVLTVQRYVGGVLTPSATDSFAGDATLSFSGSNVALGGTTIGTFTQNGGVLTISLGASTTSATVTGLLDHLTYSNAGNSTLALNVTIGATLADGNFYNVPLSVGFTGLQGTGGVLTSDPVFSVFDVAPAGSPYTATFTEPNNTPAIGATITLPAVDPVNLSAPGATLSQVKVTLGGGFVASEDVLAAVTGAATGNITSSYNAATGVLTLTSPGGTATIGQWQAVLASLTYDDTSDRPNTTQRTVTYAVTDNASTTTTWLLGNINVIAANDSPVLNTAIAVTLPIATEDLLAPPSGVAGSLVTTLANATNITDPDQNNVRDALPAGPDGMAVVTADTTLGNWWFSTNNGTTWTKFAGSSLPAISDSNVLHLAADGTTRIYFQPTVADFNGAITPAISFRAWDGKDGAANGSLAALPSDSALGFGFNTAASAYSSAVKVLNVTVAPVNDAPIATGSATLAPTLEDTGNPPGATVTTLFTPSFSDTVDTQQTGINPTGSLANTLAGVAIVGNTT
ncbi:MAG: DUF4347 domain-containing protein, partial [Alphaproteobacteria bacterium]|nr:DUF4347 domain-containing protein [Alphaproteobacteria bacterium]